VVDSILNDFVNQRNRIISMSEVTVGDVQYPEHEKMKQVQEEAHAIGQFLEWLASGEAHDSGEPIILAFHRKERAFENDNLVRMPYTIEKLLARYFEIDLKVIEAEKQDMLNVIRSGGKNNG